VLVDKPSTARAYLPESLSRVRQLCLYLASKLGDLVDAEQLVVVGGLVPSLLLQADQMKGMAPHVGTTDLDLGIALNILETTAYEELAKRLQTAGLVQDVNADDNPTLQRWYFSEQPGTTVDFLVPWKKGMGSSGRLHHIKGMAAFIVKGLHLAFEDAMSITFDDELTIQGRRATRTIRVCGPGAFVLLKALSFHNRGADKDAYDLYYVARNFGQGPEDVARHIHPFVQDPSAKRALAALVSDFKHAESIGPRAVAEFLGRPGTDVVFRMEIVQVISALFRACS